MKESEMIRRRQEYNRELVTLLQEQIENFPSERFSQVLRNLGFVAQSEVSGRVVWEDEFNFEPWELLGRVRRELRKFGPP